MFQWQQRSHKLMPSERQPAEKFSKGSWTKTTDLSWFYSQTWRWECSSAKLTRTEGKMVTDHQTCSAQDLRLWWRFTSLQENWKVAQKTQSIHYLLTVCSHQIIQKTLFHRDSSCNICYIFSWCGLFSHCAVSNQPKPVQLLVGCGGAAPTTPWRHWAQLPFHDNQTNMEWRQSLAVVKFLLSSANVSNTLRWWAQSEWKMRQNRGKCFSHRAAETALFEAACSE